MFKVEKDGIYEFKLINESVRYIIKKVSLITEIVCFVKKW